MEVILYSKECNWYTRCCLLNGGVRYRECLLREATLYIYVCCLLFVCLFVCLFVYCGRAVLGSNSPRKSLTK